MGSKRKTPGINGSSSADIAFMLLIFFLITTSMDTDKGLARRLPPPVPKDQKKNDVDVNKRNLVVVLINSSNQILFNGEPTDIKQLKDKVKEFIDNPYNDANKPEKVEEDVPFFGKVMTAKMTVVPNIRLISAFRTNWQRHTTNCVMIFPERNSENYSQI